MPKHSECAPRSCMRDQVRLERPELNAKRPGVPRGAVCATKFASNARSQTPKRPGVPRGACAGAQALRVRPAPNDRVYFNDSQDTER